MATPTGGLDIGALVQAAQLGRSLNPEVMQQQALGNQLAQQLQQLQIAKLIREQEDFNNPDAANLRKLRAQLSGQIGTVEVDPLTGTSPTFTPGLAGGGIQSDVGSEADLLAREAASQKAGTTFIAPTGVARSPIVPYLSSGLPTGLGADIDLATQQANPQNQITKLLNAPKQEALLAQIAARARTPGGYAPKYFSDVNGFQYTINPATNEKVYITDEDGDPVNVGVANRFLGTENGYVAVPTKLAGGTTARPTTLTGENNQPLVPASVTTAKSAADRKVVNDLYKAVQSNPEVKEFETISRNFETLNSIVEDTLADPSKLDDLATGRDTAAIDAFNIVFNPKGVVRQFSYVNTLQNRPLLDQGWSLWQRTFGSGGKITPEDLQSMRRLASMALENSKKSVKGQIKPILSRAEKAGVEQDDILPDSLKNIMGSEAEPQDGTVKVIRPDGKSGFIPSTNLEGALKAGYKLAQ